MPNDKSVRQNTVAANRPHLDPTYAINTVWTVSTVIKLSFSSRDSLFVDDHEADLFRLGLRTGQISRASPYQSFVRDRARKSVLFPLEGLMELFNVWSSKVGFWATRAKYMHDTTEPFLTSLYREHRKSHPTAPTPTSRTIARCRKALYDNGRLDHSYSQNFKTWAQKLNGDHESFGEHLRDQDDGFLLPELRLLEELLQSICEAYQKYEARDEEGESSASDSSSSEDEESETSPSPSAAATPMLQSPPDDASAQEADQKTLSLSLATNLTVDDSTHDNTNTRSQPPEISQPQSPSTNTSLTLSPPPSSTTSSATTTFHRNPPPPSHLLPPAFSPSHHPNDGLIFFHALTLVHKVLARLEALLGEIEGFFVLAEDMGELYQEWETKVERWAGERDRREGEWRRKERERLGVGGGEWVG